MLNPNWPHLGNIADFSYSKLSHFPLFRDLPFKSYNVGDPDPAICDMKLYQDYLTYCFIRNNVAPGSKILEVGGGDSRILKIFSDEYECWNVDKFEGLDGGPINFTSLHYRIVYDYVGSFNQELPDAYFDLVFSLSALEHTPDDQTIRVNILNDVNRVLKPGCASFHCFDAVLHPAGKSWSVNGLIFYIYASTELKTTLPSLDVIAKNPDTYFMSQQAYEINWQLLTNKSYEEYGRAFSLNLLWVK
jgi:ubiquinone/menaquinone biosynthesis C-methylase UbiE